MDKQFTNQEKIRLAALGEIFDPLCDYYGREPLNAQALIMYSNLLIDHAPDQIAKAAQAHCMSTGGSFFPTANKLLEWLGGVSVSPESIKPSQIIAAARLKKTPLGVIAAGLIGSSDLANMDSFFLNQRAEEVRQQLPQLVRDAAQGYYEDWHMSLMIKYKVNPLDPFYEGLPAPKAGLDTLKNQAYRVLTSDKHQRDCLPKNEINTPLALGQQRVSEFIKSIGKGGK
jgi:hypothetical protein